MSFVSREGIEKAASALKLRPGTLRHALFYAIRKRMNETDGLQTISSADLAFDLWGPCSDELLAKRRKQTSSLKSALNRDLKQLTDEENPEGLIISRDNVFAVSEKRKDQVLNAIGFDFSNLDQTKEIIAALRRGLGTMNPEALQDLGGELSALEKVLDRSLGGHGEGDGSDPSEGSYPPDDNQEELEVVELVEEEISENEEETVPLGDQEWLDGGRAEEGDGDEDLPSDNEEIEIVEIEETDEILTADEAVAAEEPLFPVPKDSPGRDGTGDDPGGSGLLFEGAEGDESSGNNDQPMTGQDPAEDLAMDEMIEELDDTELDELIEIEEVEDNGEEDFENIEIDESEELIAREETEEEEERLDAFPAGTDGPGGEGTSPGLPVENELVEEDIGPDKEALNSHGEGEDKAVEDGDGEDFETIELAEDEEIITIDNPEEAGEATPGADSPGRKGEYPGRANIFELLSEYLEPDDPALAAADSLLGEKEEYLARVIERFIPRFIRVRGAGHSFYIGQYPVTNDLFAIFARETGYLSEAELNGYGVVYQPKIRLAGQGGRRREIIMSRGQTAERVRGASWQFPCGPGGISAAVNPDHPVTQISPRDAAAFAAWAGKRIPTEEEWQAAAGGEQGLKYPWGNSFDKDAANLSEQMIGGSCPVNRFAARGKSPFAICDLIGNCLEWVKNSGDTGPPYILKGGSWLHDRRCDITWRRLPGEEWSNLTGFRLLVG